MSMTKTGHDLNLAHYTAGVDEAGCSVYCIIVVFFSCVSVFVPKVGMWFFPGHIFI